MSFPSPITGLKLRVSTGTDTYEQPIPSASMNGNSFRIMPNTVVFNAFNNNPAGTIFTPSIVATHYPGSFPSGDTLSTPSVSNFVPKQITPTLSLGSIPDLNALSSSFPLVPLITKNSTAPLSFSSNNTNVLSISSSGVVTVNGGGSATITITQPVSSDNVFTAAAPITRVVNVNKVLPNLRNFSPINLVYSSDLTHTLVAPTSDSANGLFTYQSSNLQVATVSGNVLRILGDGSSTIKAIQTSTNIYAAGEITTQLQVSPGDLPPGNSNLSWSNITKSLSSRAFPLIGNLAPSSTTAVSYGSEWNQLGADIDGEAGIIWGRSGWSVSLSADGNIVAIGAPFNDGTGHARVFIRDPNEPIGWRQLGSDIDGEAQSDRCGISVSLSADGNIVAIGSSRNDGTTGNSNDERGCVRVFKYHQNTNMWVQLGSNIVGEASQDFNGYFISLSSDGFIVAIAAPYNDGVSADADYNTGRVRIFKYIETTDTWVQLGGNINGEEQDEQLGWGGLSLSANGNIVAIGTPFNLGITHVKVFKYNQNTNMWDKHGNNIDQVSEGDRCGVSVSLSADGTIVAIGSNLNDGTTGNPDDNRGHVRLFKYNQNTDRWDQLGGDIVGEAEGDASGSSVSLSADGTIVAIGAPYNSGTGHARVFIRDPNEPIGWRQLGSDIDGEAAYDYSGYSVSLSSDGTIVAIGAWGNSGKYGHVKLYKIDSFNNITYTSDTPAVAGVYGNIVLLRSAGTSILTAQQTVSLTTKVATATLTVTS